jgi:nitrogen fixation protein NifZ
MKVLPRYEYGTEVRVIRSIRNDGTFPGKNRGELLIPQGSVGYVKDVGTFLQDQVIYSVDFLDDGVMVGCREHEIQLASDPWIPTRFEFRDKVTPTITLEINSEVIAEPGDVGEIEKVLREHESGPAYHVRFCGRTLQMPEKALEFIDIVTAQE